MNERESTSGKRRLYAVVEGRVQGVGFRWFVLETVRRKYPKILGWVKNTMDGKVEVLAEGSEKDVEGLLNQLKHGPSAARVERVHTRWTEPRGGLLDFDVTY